jgi:hypothetical protein
MQSRENRFQSSDAALVLFIGIAAWLMLYQWMF